MYQIEKGSLSFFHEGKCYFRHGQGWHDTMQYSPAAQNDSTAEVVNIYYEKMQNPS